MSHFLTSMNKEFPQGKENYCPQCYFENEKVILRVDCGHRNLPPSEEWEGRLKSILENYMPNENIRNLVLFEYKEALSAQKSQLIRDEECEKDGYKGRTPCRHTEFWLNEIKDKVREERERVLKILEEEIVATQMTIRGKTSGLTSAYMRIKEQNNEENT